MILCLVHLFLCAVFLVLAYAAVSVDKELREFSTTGERGLSFFLATLCLVIAGVCAAEAVTGSGLFW